MVKQVLIDSVDNGWIVSWVDDADESHKEVVTELVELRDKLVGLYA